MQFEDSYIYNNAVEAYESKNYGRALKYCEDAVLSRKLKMEKETKLLEKAIEPQEVSSVGDKISEVRAVLLKRDEYDAVNLIDFYLKKKGESYFDNSVSKLLNHLNSIKVYPEAQKLMGDIYKIEGEYTFAEMYYREALKNSSVLDIPDEKYDILYELVDISALQNDEEEKESRLLVILTEDNVFLDKAFVNSLIRQIKLNKKDSLEKFFSMYRADNYYMMKAYSELSDYYRKNDVREKALIFVSLDVITGFTKVLSIIKKRNINFEYKGLSSVLFECSLYPDIIDWGIKNNLWKSFFNLAVIARENDCYIFADDLLKILAEYLPEEYYRKAAVLQIR